MAAPTTPATRTLENVAADLGQTPVPGVGQGHPEDAPIGLVAPAADHALVLQARHVPHEGGVAHA
ncbi:MAG TPA: hypothetical protein VFV32_07670 [Acidimicrobiales bacterium]|jgi:hypothetical protein|nr:hypothetical protein [Acidimicrobiales bacterium]